MDTMGLGRKGYLGTAGAAAEEAYCGRGDERYLGDADRCGGAIAGCELGVAVADPPLAASQSD